jgi:hypothetical protein
VVLTIGLFNGIGEPEAVVEITGAREFVGTGYEANS